ncbi:alpha/beta hydrolase family protein [Bradyrhizobium sp. CAR08]
MDSAVWHHVNCELLLARRDAGTFLDNLPAGMRDIAKDQQSCWIARWMKIGDDHCARGDLKAKQGASDRASEAWLCALTAFETARRLIDDVDPRSRAISAKMDRSILRLKSSLEQRMERVKIECEHLPGLLAYHLHAGISDARAPAVICISMEEETGASLLGRLLPVVIGRGLSVLVVSHEDISNRMQGQSITLLSCCLDYLSARPDIDPARIAVYGEGLSAILATEFAVSDRRIAAAVCDGGLWSWARTIASVSWITGETAVDEVSARRSQIMRKLRCPVLVVAGGRGIVSLSEAIKLQDECAAMRIDMELAIPRMVSSGGLVENFVTSDDSIFGWLQDKLTRPQLDKPAACIADH